MAYRTLVPPREAGRPARSTGTHGSIGSRSAPAASRAARRRRSTGLRLNWRRRASAASARQPRARVLSSPHCPAAPPPRCRSSRLARVGAGARAETGARVGLGLAAGFRVGLGARASQTAQDDKVVDLVRGGVVQREVDHGDTRDDGEDDQDEEAEHGLARQWRHVGRSYHEDGARSRSSALCGTLLSYHEGAWVGEDNELIFCIE